MNRTVKRSTATHAALIENLESRTLLSASIDSNHLHPHLRHRHAHHDATIVPAVTNSTPTGYTPAQIRHAYGFDSIAFSDTTISANGAGQTIAIVDAFDDPNIASDLSVFNTQFSLPGMDGKTGHPTFSVVKPNGKLRSDSGWSLEIALDIEWAHAVAPMANIVLVEAKSASLSDLFQAVDTARSRTGVSVVSMSWGAGEFSSESSYDFHFTTPTGHSPVSFIASSGDTGAPISWPAASPNVVSVGGTSLTLDSSGNYLAETAWSGSGGGISAYETKPTFQSSVTQSSAKRTGPDVAYNADPNHGFAVYDTVATSGRTGWFQVGGTSAGAPQWAALVAITNQGRAASSKTALDGRAQLLPALYSAPGADYHDITTGSSTGSLKYAAISGYDLATGLGSPHADLITSLLLMA